MDDLGRMHSRQGVTQVAGDGQAGGQVHAALARENGLERLACEGFHDHRQATTFIDERNWLDNLRDIQGLKQQVFASETSGFGRAGVLRIEPFQQHRRPILQAAGPVERGTGCGANPVTYLIVRKCHWLCRSSLLKLAYICRITVDKHQPERKV